MLSVHTFSQLNLLQSAYILYNFDFITNFFDYLLKQDILQ